MDAATQIRMDVISLRCRRTPAIVATIAAIVCIYGMRRVDPDLYGYLAYGRLFLEQGRFTGPDPFAYTSGGLEWVTFEYAAHTLLWLAYFVGGGPGLIALKCLLGAIAVYALYRAIRVATDDASVWLPVFLLCTATLSRYFLFRPQLFTFAFFACFVAVLFRFLIYRRAALWALPVLMLVWANTHGGFLAGLGALGLAILLRASENLSRGHGFRRVFRGTNPLWASLAACAAVTLINPNGARLWRYVLTEVFHGTNRQFIAEWRPAHLSGDLWSLASLTAIAATLVILGWIAHTRVRSEEGPSPAFWALSCLPVVVMAFVSVRHTPLAAIWAGPILALLAARARTHAPAWSVLRPLWVPLTGFAAASVVLTAAVVYMQPLPAIQAGGTVLGPKDPCRTVAFLRENHFAGNLYTPLHWGSYASWHLYPDIRVSMDGRNISLFSRDLVLEHLLFYTARVSELDLGAPLRHDTDFLLVPSDFNGIETLQVNGEWQEIYGDSDAVLFLRADRAERLLTGRNRLILSPSSSCPTILE